MDAPAIVAIGTATPPYRYRQTDLLAFVERIYKNPAVRRRLGGFFGDAIEERALAIPDLTTFRADETLGERGEKIQDDGGRSGVLAHDQRSVLTLLALGVREARDRVTSVCAF